MRDNTYSLAPTYLEMAERMKSKSRSCLHQARKFGNTDKGRQAFADALSYQRIAKGMLAEHAHVTHLRDYGRTR